MDFSNGYEEHFAEYINTRSDSINVPEVKEWARRLPVGSRVLDLACGTGFPITNQLVLAGHQVFAIDASAAMLGQLKKRYPAVNGKCEAVEHSDFFQQKYHGILSIGLVFLLSRSSQILLLEKVSQALETEGKFLFTAPVERGSWSDTITGRESISLGIDEYEKQLGLAGLKLSKAFVDQYGNNYYGCEK
ncbi:MAG: class I SAM-dependent methyltransferase [Pseudohongiellaceae bacterium]